MRKLADDLVVLLERQAKGARRIELSLYRVDGAVRRIRFGASRPLNEARAIVRLIAERLASPNEDAIDAGYGVDLMRLACLMAEPLAPSEAELERAHEAERALVLAELLDRFSARLGARAVTQRELVDAHLPEQAEAAAPATLGSVRGLHLGRISGVGAPAPSCGGGDARLRGESRHREEPAGLARDDGSNSAPTRPLRLFARPEPIEAMAEVPDGPPRRFRWRRVLHDVTAIEGPERIAAPWWRHAGAPTRDYFRAEDRKAAASGSIARACGAARRRGRNGLCTGCSGERFSALRALLTRRGADGQHLAEGSATARASNCESSRAILNVRHLTTYRYKRPVEFGDHRMMLRPRDGHDQRLLSSELDIEPEPRRLRWLYDTFDNCVAVASFSGSWTSLRVENRFTVERIEDDQPGGEIDPRAQFFPFPTPPRNYPTSLGRWSACTVILTGISTAGCASS